jgi:hypothetical protein
VQVIEHARSRAPPHPLFSAAAPRVSAAAPRSSPKLAAVPHSLLPPCRILRALLPRLTSPLPMCRSSGRARAEQHRHTPFVATPLVIYDLPVPSTLPRVGALAHRATYFSSAVGRATPPPRNAVPPRRRAMRAPELCARAALHAGPLPRSGSGPLTLCRPPHQSYGYGTRRPYAAGP